MTASLERSTDRGRRFRALHDRDRPFVVPNPWDAGSARLLALSGFEALATTSAGIALSAGVADGCLDAGESLRHVEAIVAATDLPVSADLEAGYADHPDGVASIITAAAEVGAVGGSIEDRHPRGGLFEVDVAAARVAAAADAARALPFDFVLTARCESFLTGASDLGDTIGRLQAYERAGADVLYAPGLTTREQIKAVVASVERPVNVVMGLGGPTFSVAELGEMGVRRISVGSALARAAYGAFLRAVDEVAHHGTFAFAADAVPYSTVLGLLPEWSPANDRDHG